jgi:hypothetical protein
MTHTIENALTRLKNNKVKVDTINKKITTNDKIGLKLWSSIDYLKTQGYVTVTK